MKGVKPLVLKLDELVPDESTIGDPRLATLDDEKIRSTKAAEKKKQREGRRRITDEELVNQCVAKATVNLNDCSHRGAGLWAVDTANPNAWGGAEEILTTSAADFIAVQEAKVEQDEKTNKEAAAKVRG